MSEDTEIPALLEQIKAQGPDIQRRAWEDLQQYRTEALEAARIGDDVIERELRVCLARGRLKERLRKLITTARSEEGS